VDYGPDIGGHSDLGPDLKAELRLLATGMGLALTPQQLKSERSKS
jgi:hypothetical protein